MPQVRAHILIKGRVQGVFYRAETARQAQRLGVTGWVKNRWDGRVEGVFEGEEALVHKLIDWCREGPPLAHVKAVDIEWQEPTGEFETFSISW